MPRQIREIKYHPAADLTKPSIILKSAYINILHTTKKAIRRSNLITSGEELSKTAHSCQIYLKNTIEGLKKNPNVIKQQKELVPVLKAVFQVCATMPVRPSIQSLAEATDQSLKALQHMRQPSHQFFKLIQSLNDLLEIQRGLYQKSKDIRKTIRLLEKRLRSAQISTPFTDSFNQLLPSLKKFLDECIKFSKPMATSPHLKAILRNANKLKDIPGQYEKR